MEHSIDETWWRYTAYDQTLCVVSDVIIGPSDANHPAWDNILSKIKQIGLEGISLSKISYNEYLQSTAAKHLIL